MPFKHNLTSSGAGALPFREKHSIYVDEDKKHNYELDSNSLNTYADVIEKKKQALVNDVLRIFPGSRILSPEESEKLCRPSSSGSAKPERSGRESARASKHKGKGNNNTKNNSKRQRKDRRINSVQVSFDLLPGEGGTV